MIDGRLTRLEVLRGLEPVDASARLTMSASSAAPVSSAETPVKTTMKTVTEPIVETVNKAGVETSDELMVKMRKPLRYYDRRPEPKEPGLDAPVGIKQRIVVIIIGIRIAIGVFGRRGNGIDLRRQSRRVLGDPPAPIRLLARLHDALLLLAAHRYWNRVARAGGLVGGRFGAGRRSPYSLAGRRNDRVRLGLASRARQDQRKNRNRAYGSLRPIYGRDQGVFERLPVGETSCVASMATCDPYLLKF